MAQSYLAIKIVSEALKVGGRCTRCLHDGVAAKKSLHNADSVVGLVADSMGRSRGKLTGNDVDRNGMTRVGPNPDILQVQRATTEAVVAASEPKMEEKSGMMMTDPNSSMWNMCKDKKDEGVAKKLTVKFKKMKENIKQYYLERLEENQVMFTEVDEPLKIGKLDKKDRSTRFRAVEMHEEEMEPVEEVIQRPVKQRQKLSLFSQLQSSKPDVENNKVAEEESYVEPKLAPEPPQPRGYRKFSKMDYKVAAKSVEDCMGRDADQRLRVSMKAAGKSGLTDLEEGMRGERSYMEQQEPRTNNLVASIWKKPQPTKVEKEKEHREGFSELVGGMSPAIHFKTLPRVGLRQSGLLDSIKSDDLVVGFYKNKHDSRDYSTLMKYNVRAPVKSNVTETYDKFRPVNLVLQRDIANHCENTKGVGTNSLVKAHSLSTCSKYCNSDQCRPLPPKMCSYDTMLPKCPKPPEQEWPCCPKICLCGCDAPNPRVNIPNCGMGMFKALMSTAKRPEYECPSFSECSKKTTMNVKKLTECCYMKKTCDNFVGPVKPFVTALERQEINLGQKYWTGQQQQQSAFHSSARSALIRSVKSAMTQKSFFHNSAILREGESDESCEKPPTQLPCLKTSSIPGQKKKEKPAGIKGSCEKLCMPCCEPARDPPECFSVYQKPPCHKHKNPRPSFSECRKRFPFKHTMCECEVPKKPRCEEKKKNDSSCT